MIVRTTKTRDYSVICNAAFNDERLSLKAKGMYAYLMTKPNNWRISYRGLKTLLKEGQCAILGALKELEEAGYLRRSTVRDTDGKVESVSVLHENPRTVRRKSTRGKPTHLVNTKQVNTHLRMEDRMKTLEQQRLALLGKVGVGR